jgi:hypothetical protein
MWKRRTAFMLGSMLLLAMATGSAAASPLVETTKPVVPRTADPYRARFLASEIECSVAAPVAVEVNLDCDGHRSPNNEPHVVVDPADPLHVVVTSNDFNSNGDQFYTTFDGGLHWTTGNMSLESPGRIGSDPVTAIDPKSGNVIHASLNYLFGPDGSDDGDIVVSISTDGGVTWGKPVVVGAGLGDDNDPQQVFNDKGWIVTDTYPASPFYGRTYLVWSAFFARSGRYTRSPVMEAHSDDGGRTWTSPREISGSNPVCTEQHTGPVGPCDESESPLVAVGPDGTVWVSFLTPQNESAWEPKERLDDTEFVVRSADGGSTWSDPVVAATLEDGKRDFPRNVSHLPTLSGLQLRIAPSGGLAVSPTTGEVFLTFIDNRNGTHDVKHPVTDTDVFIVSSADGVTWSAPVPVADLPGDQWFPALDVDPVTGDVGVLFHSRRPQQPALYDTYLAFGQPGAFTLTRLNSDPSNAVNDAVFRAQTPGCERCATFHGDYISLDFGADGSASLAWTDMRRRVGSGSSGGFTENIVFTRR